MPEAALAVRANSVALNQSAVSSPCGLNLTADEILAHIIGILGGPTETLALPSVCHRWLCLSVCHPTAFRAPLETWRASLCHALDVAALDKDVWNDLSTNTVFEEIHRERRLTELFSELTAALVTRTKQLTSLRNLLLRFAASPKMLSVRETQVALSQEEDGSCRVAFRSALAVGCSRHELLSKAVSELRECVTLLSVAATDLCRRLPDPELPLSWAHRLHSASGEGLLMPQGDLFEASVVEATYWQRQALCRRHAEMAAIWNDYRRMFLQTVGNIEVLANSLHVS